MPEIQEALLFESPTNAQQKQRITTYEQCLESEEMIGSFQD